MTEDNVVESNSSEKPVTEYINIHPAAWFNSFFFLIALLFVFYFFSTGYINSASDSDLLLTNLVLLVMNVIMLNLIMFLIKIKTTKYYITYSDKSFRIGSVSGVWITQKKFSSDINSNMSILVNQGWLGSVLGFGDVSVFQNNNFILRLRFVRNPDEVVNNIKNLIKL